MSEPDAKLGDDSDDGGRQRTPSVSWISNQHHACGLVPTAIREKAEVLVFRQQNAGLRSGYSKDDSVFSASVMFDDSVTSCPAFLNAATTPKSQLSSARNRNDHFRGCAESVSTKTTSSCANVSAA